MKVASKLSPSAQTLLCKRYLKRGDDFSVCSHCGENHETIEELLERVSFGREDFYNMVASLDFLPGSPALFNAGGEGTLSACFKFDVQDTMESILDVGRKSALVQKWGGGVGYCLSELRSKGAHIRSTHGKACGPVSTIGYYHAIARMITQGGKREGAQMAILHCDHKDIEEFIHCKELPDECRCLGCSLADECDFSRTTTLDTFNISVAITDEFMKKVVNGEKSESKLFDEIVENAWSNGDPGLFFIDTVERTNPTPWLGKLTGSNPCGEVALLDNESCNLGSINLSHFVTPDPKHVGYGIFDFERLRDTTRLAVRYLDRVLDENFYPVSEVKVATLLTRKLGLGVMGWADALALMRISYGSQEAVGLAEEVMQNIQKVAHDESAKLGAEKSLCPAFTVLGFPKDQHREGTPYLRNACVTCVAPTGSISVLADCSSGIEPHYSLDYTQVMGDGTKLRRKLDFGDFVPKTAHEIDWSWHVKHQAAFQMYTDLAVSKTINMPNSATIEDVKNAYILAWKSNCKGVTVYREGSRVKQALELHSDGANFDEVDYDAKVHRFRVGDVKGFLHWGLSQDNTPFEVFITAYKQGSMVEGLLDAVAILISMSLQSGVPLEKIVKHMRGRRFEPSGLTGNSEIPTATSILDYIAKYAQLKFLGAPSSYNSGMICPVCGAHAISQSGCLVCSENCGWSRC